MAIKLGSISTALVTLAGASLVFLVTIANQPQVVSLATVVSIIMIFGVVLGRSYSGDRGETGVENRSTLNKVGVYTAADLVVFYALNSFVPIIPQYLSGVLLAGTVETKAFSFLIATAESVFFTYALANYFLSKVGPAAAAPLVGIVAAVYHLFVYNSAGVALIVVFGAFSTMTYLNYKAGVADPSVLSHVIWDVFLA